MRGRVTISQTTKASAQTTIIAATHLEIPSQGHRMVAHLEVDTKARVRIKVAVNLTATELAAIDPVVRVRAVHARAALAQVVQKDSKIGKNAENRRLC